MYCDIDAPGLAVRAVSRAALADSAQAVQHVGDPPHDDGWGVARGGPLKIGTDHGRPLASRDLAGDALKAEMVRREHTATGNTDSIADRVN